MFGNDLFNPKPGRLLLLLLVGLLLLSSPLPALTPEETGMLVEIYESLNIGSQSIQQLTTDLKALSQSITQDYWTYEKITSELLQPIENLQQSLSTQGQSLMNFGAQLIAVQKTVESLNEFPQKYEQNQSELVLASKSLESSLKSMATEITWLKIRSTVSNIAVISLVAYIAYNAFIP